MTQSLQILVDKASSALGQGELELAESLSREACALSPRDLGANLLLGTTLSRLQRGTEALAHFRLATQLDPGRFSAWFALGKLCLELGDLAQAAEALRVAVELTADNAPARHCLAIALHQQGRFEQALPHYQRAAELAPTSSQYLNDLGVVQTHLGMAGQAASSYRQALEADPDRGKLYYHYSTVHRFAAGDPVIAAMESRYASAQEGSARRVYLAFALGKAYQDLQDYERAFHYLQEGNRRYRETYQFSVDAERDRLQRIRRHFNAAESLPTGSGPARNAVFIMGMPRSGTSLTEQILASHSGVKAIGESDFFGAFVRRRARQLELSFPEILQHTSAGELRDLADEYWDKYAATLPADACLVEKTTLNFYYAGLLRQLFPAARFVHCSRDPVATCWSIYSRLFVQGGHHYGYDLEEVGDFFRVHEAYVAHWRAQFPEAVHTLDYGRLTAEPETEVRALLDFCGLQFEPGCLSPHSNSRGVRTASAAQVRQPIYHSDRPAWEPYAAFLEPLHSALSR